MWLSSYSLTPPNFFWYRESQGPYEVVGFTSKIIQNSTQMEAHRQFYYNLKEKSQGKQTTKSHLLQRDGRSKGKIWVI